MSDTITRAHCGFAIFDQCDPDKCTEPCFTARVIDLDARHQPAKPVLPTWAMAAILAVAVAFLAVCAAHGLPRAETSFQQEQRR